MQTTYEYRTTGTAADLIAYEPYIDSTGNSALTRVENSLQGWMVKETNGETFYIKFDNNLLKKHFVTESKNLQNPTNINSKIGKLIDLRSTPTPVHART
jgi:hypothetical protein